MLKHGAVQNFVFDISVFQGRDVTEKYLVLMD